MIERTYLIKPDVYVKTIKPLLLAVFILTICYIIDIYSSKFGKNLASYR